MGEAALVRSICHESFFEFVKEFWHVVVAEPFRYNWHIEYLCKEFQADAERVFRNEPREHDTVVNIPPGTTKSTILSIMAPAWVHARRPDMRVLAASHTQLLVFELGRKCRMVEDSPQYRAAFPEVVPAPDQWTKSFFMNTRGGGRMACTVGGMSPIGFHAHFIIIDDPMDPLRAASAPETETANKFMDEVLPTRKVDKTIAVTWLIMQRLGQNDPSGHALASNTGGIRHICIPAELAPNVNPPHLRRRYVNGLLDPVRLSRETLDESRKKLGEYGFSGQFRQQPMARGGTMFKVERVQIEERAPWAGDRRWVGMCRFWDKAGTAGGGCYTAGFLMGRWRDDGAPKDGSGDVWWILGMARAQLDSGDREKLITDTAKVDGKRVIVGLEQEPGSGGKESAQNTAKRLAGYRVRIAPAVGSKVERADMWSSMVNAGAFRIVAAPWTQALLDEMQYFPNSDYKDQVDSGAGAFTILANSPRRVGAV